MRFQLKNCWSHALQEFEKKEGWVLVRFTKRSAATPKPKLAFFGKLLIIIGIFLANWGFLFRTGRWLHAYHARSTKGPYTSYEPKVDKHLKHPPLKFDGEIVTRDELS